MKKNEDDEERGEGARLIPMTSFGSISMASVASESTAFTAPYHGLMLRQLFASLAWSILGWYGPKVLVENENSIAHKQIPVQVTKAGDVILDPSLSYPLVDPPAIPSDFLVKMSVWLPILIILTSPWWSNLLCCHKRSISSSSGNAWTDRLLQWQVQGRLCAFFTVVGLSEGSTQLVKFMVQRRRPNFYALCRFDVQRQVCTGSIKAIRDANFSFPSGHSSLSMCAMSFLVWMFLGMLLSTLSNKRKLVPSATEWWKPTRLECLQCSALLVTVLPLSWAVFVGATRLVDHWHHPADVLAGLLLGGITGTIGYHLWFPPIWKSSFLGPTYPWSAHVLYESSPSASMEMAPRTE